MGREADAPATLGADDTAVHQLLMQPGLVDAGYRGEIKVVLVNLSGEAFEIERGDRIAQFVVVPVAVQEFVPVEELPDSTRGSGGFGHTG